MTFLELAEKVLTEENKPLTPGDMWNIILKKGYNKLLNSKGKTPEHTFGAHLYVNSKDLKSKFASTNERPKRFYLKSQKDISFEDINVVTEHEQKQKKEKEYLEKDLHPFLSYFAFHKLNYYTKTINHSLSSKKEFGEWIHPDMVGVYFPIEEWRPEVFELNSELGNISVDLISFEIKRDISFTNLREVFFQTVSNSTWANESYLVASEISDNKDFHNELSRLSDSFGIGVIKLDIKNPNLSKIIYSSIFRENLDWETINKLTNMNSDFKEFIKRVTSDIQIKEIRKEQYDKIYTEKELKKRIKK